ncbi:putative sodium-coupled neutral amino acid transporter 6 [Micractinium conductrix]|nr:putative sodium-coupled neutral amino acid transporter 6 [Micractinium conductrix]|eukprot:PSC67140.1 putative sodium-coupled neutral amino acid transporter 6 [Micractinium conductrix]
MNIDDVTDILWGNVPLAMGFVATVKVAMALSLVLSFPITLWPMRQDIIETLSETLGTHQQLTPAAYYSLTYISLLLIYLLAISISSAYQMVGLIGSVTGTAMGFFFPGMLALRDPGGGWRLRALGWCLLAAGALLTVIGITSMDED